MLLGEVVVVVFVEEALGPEAVAAAARSLLTHVGVGAPGKRLLQCPQSQCTHSFNRYKLRRQAMVIRKWPLNNSDHTALEHQQLNKNNANSAEDIIGNKWALFPSLAIMKGLCYSRPNEGNEDKFMKMRRA